MTEQQSKVLTLVFTDLADSTALKTERGDRAVHDLIEAHRAHVMRLAEECSGRVIDWAGDGCFLTFETSSAGVMFALRLQQVHADNPDLPGVRIGIHMGEVSQSEGPQGPDGPPRIDGLAVDIAARIAGLAKPGQVLMSSSVYGSARQRLGVDAFGKPVLWQTHGTYELKGFDEPLDIGEASLEGFARLEAPKSAEKARLIKKARKKSRGRPRATSLPREIAPLILAGIVVSLAAALVFVLGGRFGGDPSANAPADSPITSLAVLPLDNLSGDPEQEIFSDGMTEAIIAELAKIKALKVVSRTSVMRYKDTDLSMPEIATELGVQGIIEGSVLREDNDVRITVQLIDGRTDTHVWSDSYTETMTSVLKLQSDVALSIANAIEVRINPEETQRVAESREVNPDAYDAFLLGSYFREMSVSMEGLERARRQFEQAIEVDPEFAEAWSGVGGIYVLQTWLAGADPIPNYASARRALRKALELDPEHAPTHSMLGNLAVFADWDWDEGDRRTLRALTLAPSDVPVHRYRIAYLRAAGRWSEALEEIQAIRELAPGNPDASIGSTLINLGRLDEGIAEFENVYRTNPENGYAMNGLVQGYRNNGEYDKALELADVYMETTQGSVAARTAKLRALAAAGRIEEAQEMIDALIADPDGRFDPHDLGEAYIMLGEIDRALEWFERGVSERWIDTHFLPAIAAGVRVPKSEHTERLSRDPRYWDLIERVGFPPLPPEHPGYEAEQAWFEQRRAAEEANAPIRKIAVLPFDNMSSDPEQEYFVDGMTEALIAELAKIKSIKVISRTSVMQYKETEKSMPEIATELGVDALIEGSVMKAGEEVRITAQLVNGRTDEHLWAESYTNTVENVFKLQAEVALTIAGEIDAAVTDDERNRITSASVVETRAYELYIEGRALWSARTADGFAAALDRYEKALEIDSDFVLAHLGIADAYVQQADYTLEVPTVAYERAWPHVQRAFEQANPPGEAYASRARLKQLRDFDWSGAEEDLLQSIELNPANATARLWYSLVLNATGRRDEAYAQVQSAFELDPFSPVILGVHLERMADQEPNDDVLRRIQELERDFPDEPRVLAGIGYAYERLGRCDDAIEAQRRAGELRNESGIPVRATVIFALCGRENQALEQIASIRDAVIEMHNGASYVAEALAAMNRNDEAFEWLDRATEWRDPGLFYLGVSGHFEEIRYDARFTEVLARVNLLEHLERN